jgi:hypothetical protein
VPFDESYIMRNNRRREYVQGLLEMLLRGDFLRQIMERVFIFFSLCEEKLVQRLNIDVIDRGKNAYSKFKKAKSTAADSNGKCCPYAGDFFTIRCSGSNSTTTII